MGKIMKKYNLNYESVTALIDHLKTKGSVYAPHRTGDESIKFDKVSISEEVILDYSRTLQSVKKYFLPPKETLLSFSLDKNTFEKPEIISEDRIFLGVHSYDMQAVLRLDFNFTQGNPEWNYMSRREKSIFIGVSFEPDEYHFSRSVGISVEEMEGFDLFLNCHGTGYTVHVVSEKGQGLLAGFNGITKALNQPFVHKEFQNKIKYNHNRLSDVLAEAWDFKVWEDVAEKCVGCGTCNLVCPTCYCFNVSDDVDLSLTHGSRERSWDGCMLNSFALVAGGENFRGKLAQRQRHRVYRKFKYITELTGEPWCTGCGRCTAYCTAGISLVGIVNACCEEYEHRHVHRNISNLEDKKEGVTA